MEWEEFIERKRARDERENAIKEILVGIMIAILMVNDWDFTINKIVEFLENLY